MPVTGTLQRPGSTDPEAGGSTSATGLRGLRDRIARRLPATPGSRAVRALAWASLVSQTLIVGTGGLVRLTGSGLGCPTWPRCTAESFVSTPEMGIHGVIEFGNRLLTFVLVVIAVAMFVAVLRMRRERRDLFALSIVLGLGIPGQAIIGGITVLTNLNPYVVGLHYVLSTVLVCVATVLVYRVHRGRAGGVDGVRSRVVPAWFARTAHVMAAVVGVTILVGILTTGSGPHAGDHGAARNGLDSELLQHVHSWPAYAMLALTVLLAAVAVLRGIDGPRRFLIGLLLAQGAQIALGLVQARLGLPPFLVGAHMVLACVVASLATATLLSLRR
jgi:heme a synthase